MRGKEVCLIIDVALGKGGPESIVESYYSTMKSQQQPGGQSNKTLSFVPNLTGACQMSCWEKRL